MSSSEETGDDDDVDDEVVCDLDTLADEDREACAGWSIASL